MRSGRGFPIAVHLDHDAVIAVAHSPAVGRIARLHLWLLSDIRNGGGRVITLNDHLDAFRRIFAIRHQNIAERRDLSLGYSEAGSVGRELVHHIVMVGNEVFERLEVAPYGVSIICNSAT